MLFFCLFVCLFFVVVVVFLLLFFGGFFGFFFLVFLLLLFFLFFLLLFFFFFFFFFFLFFSLNPAHVPVVQSQFCKRYSCCNTILLTFFFQCFNCSAVALSVSFFPFNILNGKCSVTVSIPDHCLPFYM